MGVKLKNEVVGGETCWIEVDTYGRFDVYPGDGPVENGDRPVRLGSAATLNAAIEEAKKTQQKRKVRVKIPFVTLNGEHGIVTGFHAGTGNVLADIGGQRGVQLGGYSAGSGVKVFPGDADPKVVEEYIEQQSAKRAAERRIRDIEREHVIDISKVAGEKVDELVAARDEEMMAAAAVVADPA